MNIIERIYCRQGDKRRLCEHAFFRGGLDFVNKWSTAFASDDLTLYDLVRMFFLENLMEPNNFPCRFLHFIFGVEDVVCF